MFQITKAVVFTQPSGSDPRLYLITIHTGLQSTQPGDAFPQALATVDDFGELVIVRSWR